VHQAQNYVLRIPKKHACGTRCKHEKFWVSSDVVLGAMWKVVTRRTADIYSTDRKSELKVPEIIFHRCSVTMRCWADSDPDPYPNTSLSTQQQNAVRGMVLGIMKESGLLIVLNEAALQPELSPTYKKPIIHHTYYHTIQSLPTHFLFPHHPRSFPSSHLPTPHDVPL
jgi:hypothetical protein